MSCQYHTGVHIPLECIESRSYVLQHRSTTPNKFVPRCRDDGTYAAVQCMDNAGCWCSDPQGKPVPNTTTRTGRPNCPKKAKSNTRRSPQSHLNLNRPRRGCTRADQVVFNANLIRVFHSEHGRLMLLGQLPASVGLHGGSNGNGNGGGTALGLGVKSHHASASALSDKAIVDWKFALLDANRNHQLERQEFRELKRLVRKVRVGDAGVFESNNNGSMLLHEGRETETLRSDVWEILRH